MKNPAPYLRETLGTLLDGNVTYNDGEGFNGVVPVVASEGTDSKYEIFIGEYSDSDRSNKNTFGATSTQIIEVVGTQETAAKKHVDAIGELVMNLIHPTPGSNLLSNSDFSIMVLGKPSLNPLIEPSGDGRTKIVRLIMRFYLLIHENS